MDEELRKAIEDSAKLAGELKTDIAEFRKTQEDKFKQIDAHGEADVKTQAKLDELASRLDAMTAEQAKNVERLDLMETASKRHVLDGKPEDKSKPFGTFGEQLLAVVNASDPAKVRDPRLAEVKQTGLSEGVGADGGFLVQTDFASEVLVHTHDVGSILARTRKIPISTNANGLRIPGINETSRADGSRYGGVLAYWRGEAAAKTASQPEYRMIELNLKKLTGLVYATDELLQDAAALEAFVMMALPQELNFKAEDAIIRGTGAGQPLGILPSGATVTVTEEVGQAADTFLFENAANMYARMWAPSMSNAVWYINQDVLPHLMMMYLQTGATGLPVYMPAGGISGAPYSTMFGRPVIPVEYCSTVGDIGDVIFADMSQYLIIEKGGVQAASSIHVRFVNDETVFRFVWRIDGQPLWNATLTPFQGANDVSPFVVLETR